MNPHKTTIFHNFNVLEIYFFDLGQSLFGVPQVCFIFSSQSRFFLKLKFYLKIIQCEAEKELSSEQRVRIMNELPKTIAEAAQKVHKAANVSSAEDFLAVLEVSHYYYQKVHKAANASSAEDFLAVLEVCYHGRKNFKRHQSPNVVFTGHFMFGVVKQFCRF